ncbi:MAG TPA: SH3 domain-containing protein [Anaerolineales bacterium]|nr:SH3 domain-containing protein [Anaerolineales bacterium]HNN12731.1 SH3 domain-containing protein [Anaerolineales bacterium]HNO31007.1 SH3 domain-containing protein [Anaerolineales bacterium]
MKKYYFALLLLVFTQGCFAARRPGVGFISPGLDTPSQPTVTPQQSRTPRPTPTAAPAATEIPPTLQPIVTITAVKGNLYIRRGPGTEYDRVGVLYKGESTEIIGQDVLSKWVQVQVPDSDRTGWVSIMTEFSKLDGDLTFVPDFTFTEWPQPAYIKNCTEHDVVVEPGDIYLYNLFTNSKYLNESQVDPGVYTIFDMFLPGEPEIQTVDVREGETIYITVDGDGTKHKCP